MVKRYLQYLIPVGVIIVLLTGCAATPSSTPGVQPAYKSFKDYPDHAFNPKDYVKGMEKGGHNLLIWQDPSADLRGCSSVSVGHFGDRLLPLQAKFSYTPFVKSFNLTFQRSLSLTQEESQNALRIEGAIVECNPGSRAARYWVGYGAGKAGGAAVCEVYEPNQSRPSMRIYVRDTASFGGFGGDSVAMLNHILEQVAIRLSAALEDRIGY